MYTLLAQLSLCYVIPCAKAVLVSFCARTVPSADCPEGDSNTGFRGFQANVTNEVA